jgi:predicted AAA+ superfamily ATPase
MERFARQYLKEWKTKPSRKPLVLRGARQVGKSYLVRRFAKDQALRMLEINFERLPEAASLFASKDPKTICRLLEARFGTPLVPGMSLLFLDEIQAAPEVFAVLRYFREELPELHVIAAGSLLEFVLTEHAFSMPVGRVEYLHLGPMFFEEFLLALGRGSLRDWLLAYQPGGEAPAEIHAELSRLMRQYLVVGGMPEAVAAFAGNGSYLECEQVQESVLATYRDDFGKYAQRIQQRRVAKVFTQAPMQVGRKFMYRQVDKDERARDLGDALRLLQLARVLHKVRHTHANGVPLGAEADERNFKILFLDVGLLCRACGLRIADLPAADDALLVNRGAVCEQVVGQHLLHAGPFYVEPEIFYWMREARGSCAELDFVAAIGDRVVPIEVKAGKTGTLKSMHVFLAEKQRRFGLRFNLDVPSLLKAETCLATGPRTAFRLLSLPLYLVGQAERLCRSSLAEGGG